MAQIYDRRKFLELDVGLNGLEASPSIHYVLNGAIGVAVAVLTAQKRPYVNKSRV